MSELGPSAREIADDVTWRLVELLDSEQLEYAAAFARALVAVRDAAMLGAPCQLGVKETKALLRGIRLGFQGAELEEAEDGAVRG